LATRKSTTATKKPAAKKSTKTTATKAATKSSKAATKEVTIDRRGKSAERRTAKPAGSDEPKIEPKLERRAKVQRRRQIDPTTCERDYTDAEVAFMSALDDYKRKSGRMFPTCSEVLEVIRGLGYVQLTPAELAAREGTQQTAVEADTPVEPDPLKAFATPAEAHLVRS
jgi:hypothetical protein